MNVIWIVISVFIFLMFFPIIFVRGDSMYPAIQHGDILFSARVFSFAKCKPGRIFVYRVPEKKFVIKRLIGIADGEYYFDFDNKDDSPDNHDYDIVDPKNVKAEIIGVLYRIES